MKASIMVTIQRLNCCLVNRLLLLQFCKPIENAIFPHPKMAKQVKSNMNTMLIRLSDAKGIAHTEFLPPCQTVNQEFYLLV